MAGEPPEQLLLRKAWARLWTPGTKYYLPTVITKGAQGAGITVDPLGNLIVPDTGSISLFSKEPWGSIAIELTEGKVGGLGTVADGGMTYEPQSGAFSATIKIGQLAFTGNYEVTTGGIAGCAIDAAAAVLKVLRTQALADESAEPAGPALATSYREQLLQSENGTKLVSTYYDQNETLHEMVTTPNFFSEVWREGEPEGPPTSYYAEQTEEAAKNPDDESKKVNDRSYRKFGLYVHTALLESVSTKLEEAKAEGNAAEIARYRSLRDSILNFTGKVEPYKEPMTVKDVMDRVEKPHPPALQAGEADPLREEAERRFQEDLPRLEEQVRAREAEQEEADTSNATPIKGKFRDEVSNGSLKIAGKVVVSGTMPDLTLTVTLSSITPEIPGLDITLGGDGDLLTAVQNWIAKASWFQDILAHKVGEELNSSTVLNYLADRINQSLSEALGPPE